MRGLVVWYLVSTVLGVYAADAKRRGLLVVVKPLTTFLLFFVVGWPRAPLAWWVDAGIVFSLAGDVALLVPSKKAFLVGLVFFLGTHLSYVVGFAGAAGTAFWSVRTLATAIVMAGVMTWLLRQLWAGAAGMRAPLVAYATALGAMVISAVAATGGGVPWPAALGAALFFVADGSLSLDQFHRPIKHAPILTLGVYWLGQLGIALAVGGG
jgi:uncharacterized membrane protein YhhN